MLVNNRMMIYFVRHAEAEHNVREKEAVRNSIERGESKNEQEAARKSILNNPLLRDAPLSYRGTLEARRSHNSLEGLMASGDSRYQPPKVVLVSPLRRALMTATLLFHHPESKDNPKFLALEILREKRTGLPCDERHDVETLRKEFTHVNFDDVERGLPIVNPGEDNTGVKARTKVFLEERLPEFFDNEFVAVVSHKGWLREIRHTLKDRVTNGSLDVDFDIDQWDETLYKNSEVRVAEFSWGSSQKLESVVSRSVENAMSSIVVCPPSPEAKPKDIVTFKKSESIEELDTEEETDEGMFF